MAFDVPTTEPDVLIAGDTWRWTKTFADYPTSEGWALTYYITGPVSIPAVTASVVDNQFSVTVTATTTTPLPPGTYRYVARASLSGAVHTAGEGVFLVKPNLAVAKDGETLTHEERSIPLLEAALERRIKADLQAYSLSSRSATKEEMQTYRRLLNQYRRIVWQRRNPGYLGPMRTVRFVAG